MATPKSEFPRPIYLSSAVRSPIGKFGGTLKRLNAPALATLALKEFLDERVHAKADGVFLGHARQGGAAPNPARQAAVKGGFAESVPAITFNQACASGMTAIFAAIEKISMGHAHQIWAGGAESMSNTPYLLPNVRWGLRLGHSDVIDGMTRDGFYCPLADMLMGATVERYIAQERKISRQAQDAYALESQKRAEQAWNNGLFKAETFVIPADANDPK